MPIVPSEWASEAASRPPLPPTATPLQQWRFRRDLVIYVAHKCGFSQRALADVFDLPNSRIYAIVRRLRQYDPALKQRAEDPDDPWS
jgi:hypothetical protein